MLFDQRDGAKAKRGRSRAPASAPPTSSAPPSPTLLVYGAGWNQVPVIEASRRRGLRVVAIDRDPQAPGARLADRFHCLSLRDHDAIVRAIESESIGGIVARITDATALASAHRLARTHGLATACPALVEAATSKLALAEACRDADLRTPPRLSPSSSVALDAGPVVVRPDVTIEGKSGIRRVASRAELEAACGEAAARSANGRVDVSRWIEGEDVSILVHLDRGRARRLALWDEWVALDATGAVRGIGCALPSRFEGDSAAIDATLERLAAVFPESRTLAVVSLRIDSRGEAWLIEIHLGVGGDGIADRLLPAAFPDFDAFDLLVRAQADEALEPSFDAPRPRALVRGGRDGELVVAADVAELHAHVRATLPADWTWPRGLVPRSERETS